MTGPPDALRAAWQAIPRAVSATIGRNDATALAQALARRPLLVIAASGNSAYPARYLAWLLERATTLHVRVTTPLAYALTPPRAPHCCLLVSQGARRRDSFSVMEIAQRLDAPLFVLCGAAAQGGGTVAAALPASQVFTTETLGEHAFLHVTGTAAAFAAAYEVAAALDTGLPLPFPVPPWDDLRPVSPWDELRPAAEPSAEILDPAKRVIALYGPAGQCAAEAFAGYHCESLSPALAMDMKGFTHGVWRGLGEAGRARVYLVADRQVAPLARFLHERLSAHHDCSVVRASQTVPAPVEPFDLFVGMTACWITRAEAYARAHGNAWSPLEIDKARWGPLLDLTRYDVAALAAPTDHP